MKEWARRTVREASDRRRLVDQAFPVRDLRGAEPMGSRDGIEDRQPPIRKATDQDGQVPRPRDFKQDAIPMRRHVTTVTLARLTLVQLLILGRGSVVAAEPPSRRSCHGRTNLARNPKRTRQAALLIGCRPSRLRTGVRRSRGSPASATAGATALAPVPGLPDETVPVVGGTVDRPAGRHLRHAHEQPRPRAPPAGESHDAFGRGGRGRPSFPHDTQPDPLDRLPAHHPHPLPAFLGHGHWHGRTAGGVLSLGPAVHLHLPSPTDRAGTSDDSSLPRRPGSPRTAAMDRGPGRADGRGPDVPVLPDRGLQA